MLLSIVANVLALSLAPLARADEVSCWAPDGETRADNETYVPCNKLGIEQEGVFSSCCNLDDKDPDERDLCTTSGLCLKGNSLFRGYCTDKSWDSPACVDVCTDEENGGTSNGTAEISPCGDGTYCCGHNNLNCCDTDKAFTLPTQSSVVASNVTETAVVTEAANSSSAYKDATIGLAVVLGVVALAALLGILWLLKKNRELSRQIQQNQQPPAHAQMQQTPQSQYMDPYLQEQEDERRTEITSASSPSHGHSAFAPYKPPTSPSVPEIDGNHHRYSELDATSTQHRSYGPASPDLDRSMSGTPMQSQ